MKSSSAVSSSQPDAFQRVESVSEAEPTHSSDSVSESERISEAERVPRWAAEAVVGKLVPAVGTMGDAERVVLKVESVAEVEPAPASAVFSAHAASELVSEAELGHESDPVSEEEPAHASATVELAQTPKVEEDSKSHASCLSSVVPFWVALLGWVIATIADEGKVGFIAPVVQR
jgi:hypothetical protein